MNNAVLVEVRASAIVERREDRATAALRDEPALGAGPEAGELRELAGPLLELDDVVGRPDRGHEAVDDPQVAARAERRGEGHESGDPQHVVLLALDRAADLHLEPRTPSWKMRLPALPAVPMKFSWPGDAPGLMSPASPSGRSTPCRCRIAPVTVIDPPAPKLAPVSSTSVPAIVTGPLVMIDFPLRSVNVAQRVDQRQPGERVDPQAVHDLGRRSVQRDVGPERRDHGAVETERVEQVERAVGQRPAREIEERRGRDKAQLELRLTRTVPWLSSRKEPVKIVHARAAGLDDAAMSGS